MTAAHRLEVRHGAAALLISPELARALSDGWRARILMELSVRPMSPSQFVGRVGGEISHIARCFRQLARWGYVEVIDEQTGGHRRGGVEHTYRCIERAHFDVRAWEGLSSLLRNDISRAALDSYLARILESVRAGTFDAEVDRHLSWSPVSLDRVAWTQLVTRLDEILDWLPGLEIEAVERMSSTGEEPIITTAGLAAFRAPKQPEVTIVDPTPAEAGGGAVAPDFGVSAEWANALRSKWRARVLMELSVRPMSPSQFVSRVGGEISHIARCFRQLSDWEYVEVIDERTGGRRRGGVERVYRSTRRAHIDTATWERFPFFLRQDVSRSALESYFARIAEAVRAGTFDAEIDRHFSWDTLSLDRTAWVELGTRLDGVLDWLPVLEQEAARRLLTGGNTIPATVGLAAFRTPHRAP